MSHAKPLGDRVLVAPLEHVKEVNGILLPDPEQPDITEGQIVAVGTGATEDEFPLDFNAVYAAREFEQSRGMVIDDFLYVTLDADDIMALARAGNEPLSERIVKASRKWVYIEWEQAKDTIMGGRLLRAETNKKAHFTGTVIAVGEDVEEVEVGRRYFFEQFADFKPWSEGAQRYAMVPERAFYCEIPARDTDLHLADSEVAVGI